MYCVVHVQVSRRKQPRLLISSRADDCGMANKNGNAKVGRCSRNKYLRAASWVARQGWRDNCVQPMRRESARRLRQLRMMYIWKGMQMDADVACNSTSGSMRDGSWSRQTRPIARVHGGVSLKWADIHIVRGDPRSWLATCMVEYAFKFGSRQVYRKLLCGTPLLEWAGCWDGTSYIWQWEKFEACSFSPLPAFFFRRVLLTPGSEMKGLSACVKLTTQAPPTSGRQTVRKLRTAR